jgi:hypothetical protein
LIWNKKTASPVKRVIQSSAAPLHKMVIKSDWSNYRGISLLSTSYKILPNTGLCMLTLHADEIIQDHQCGFLCNKWTTDIISTSSRHWKNGNIMVQYISYLPIPRKPTM